MTTISASAAAPGADRAFCERMLPDVSRTFALTIRMLPPGLEYPVLVAYLLCRVADTIEDATDLDGGDKVRLLAHFRRCLDADGPEAGPLRDAFAGASRADGLLVQEADAVLREYRRLPTAQQSAIRPWVQEMCDGMAEFSARPADDARGLRVLETIGELERYCYYVAGTVGHLLTALFRLHDGHMSAARAARLEQLATAFGLGLQLTNIVKDVADDRRRGVSFVPRELFTSGGIRPEDLASEDHAAAARRVLSPLIAQANRHLADALRYCTTLPRRQYRIRLFCLTALYFAVRTLRLARHDPRVSGTGKLKISRGAVYRTVAAAYVVAPSNAMVRAYYGLLAGPGA